MMRSLNEVHMEAVHENRQPLQFENPLTTQYFNHLRKLVKQFALQLLYAEAHMLTYKMQDMYHENEKLLKTFQLVI